MTDLFETKSKTVPITKEMVWEAYKKVRSNHGAGGVDKESLEQYATKRSTNLYKLWNRLASGSYFPQPVREVKIPKQDGGERKLGIPTVNDRIAQEVIRAYIEPRLEAIFVEDSYGYRPQKSAIEAVKAVRSNVYKYAWVVDMDIASFFDEVSHELLMRALEVRVSESWVKMYIGRWLETPIQTQEGTLIQKEGRGTPQGGVISPLLSNLFLHYVLDKWLEKYHPKVRMVRYADDVIIHCNTEEEALQTLQAIRARLEECQLRLNEQKTRIVYCKQVRRMDRNNYSKKFDFLGFTFKPKMIKDKQKGRMFLGISCGISMQAQKRIVGNWKKMKIHRQTTKTITEIAEKLNPQLRGIIQYYGKISVYTLGSLMWNLEQRLRRWAQRKYKNLRKSYKKGNDWMVKTKQSYQNLFYHWAYF